MTDNEGGPSEKGVFRNTKYGTREDQKHDDGRGSCGRQRVTLGIGWRRGTPRQREVSCTVTDGVTTQTKDRNGTNTRQSQQDPRTKKKGYLTLKVFPSLKQTSDGTGVTDLVTESGSSPSK